MTNDEILTNLLDIAVEYKNKSDNAESTVDKATYIYKYRCLLETIKIMQIYIVKSQFGGELELHKKKWWQF